MINDNDFKQKFLITQKIYQNLHQTNAQDVNGLNLEQITNAVRYEQWGTIRIGLVGLSIDELPDNFAFLYPRGIVLWLQLGNRNKAKDCFMKARHYFEAVKQDPIYAAICLIEIADILHEEGQYFAALHFIEEASCLLEQAREPNDWAQGRLWLLKGVIYPCIGKVRAGINCVKQASDKFSKCNDNFSNFISHLNIIFPSLQVGAYQEAQARLEVAKVLYLGGGITPKYFCRVLNAQLHYQWYSGNFEEAHRTASEMLNFAEKHSISEQRVYACVLIGNLYRAQSKYGNADQWYKKTREVATEVGLTGYTLWIDIQAAWLYVLTSDYKMARQLVEGALKTVDCGYWISFNITLAVLNNFQQRFDEAEALLLMSLDFYKQSGEELAQCAINFLLAHTYLKLNKFDLTYQYLSAAFTWLQQHNLDYFPHWWHPYIISEICVYTISSLDNFRTLAERILKKQVGTAGLYAIGKISPLNHVLLEQLQSIIEDEDRNLDTTLDFIEEKVTKDVLRQLMVKNVITKKNIIRLKETLFTAQRQRKPNPKLIAIFCLYLTGSSRQEIAGTLNCSEALVRLCINEIYQIFDLELTNFSGTTERKRHLYALARSEGFLQ